MHKLCEKFVRFESSWLGFILRSVRLSSGGPSLILVATTPQVAALHSSWWLPHPKWYEPLSQPLHKLLFLIPCQFISISYMSLSCCSWFCFCYMLMVHHLVRLWQPFMFTFFPFPFHIASHLSLYIDFSSLALWSASSHLLNHLVKFVSSGNLP